MKTQCWHRTSLPAGRGPSAVARTLRPPATARGLQNRRNLGLVLLVGALMAGLWPASAAAPANDVCTSPQVIPAAGPFPHTTAAIDITDATIQPSDPPPGNPFLTDRVAKSVWFRFTPARNGIYTVTTCADFGSSSTVADTVLGVYTSSGGCNGPFTQQAEGDEDCGPNGAQASVSLPLTADTTYYIVVWKYCDNCVDDGLNRLELVLSGSVPPPNDTCADPLPLPLNLPVTGTTVAANDSYHLEGTNGFSGLDQTVSPAAGRDVVYSFTAPAAGSYSIKALHYDVNQDLVLYAIASCPAAGTPPLMITNCLAAANRSRVNSAEQISWMHLEAAEKVLIVVDDNNSANQGSAFTLEVTISTREQEPNNSPETASSLVSGVEGSISPQMDADFYVLGRYPAGWRAFALVDAEAARSPDLDLRVTTTNDTVHYDNDNNDVVFGESAPNIAGAPLPGGSTFLLVSYSGNLRESEPYRLYAVVQPPLEEAAPEIEPNGDPASASADDRNYFYGTLQGPPPSDDVDVYQFSVAEGDLIFASLDGDPYRTNSPINARLELLDASGNQLILVNDDASSSSTNGSPGFFPTSPSEGLVYRSAVEGVFFARVSISPTAAGNAASGAYLLSISRNGVIGATGQNHPPALNSVTLPSPIAPGLPTQLTGTLLDLDIGDALALEIRWGDGGINTLQFPEPGQIDFAVTHIYLEPDTTQVITVTVTDRAGATDSETRTVHVSPSVLTIAPPQAGQVTLQLHGKRLSRYRVDKSDLLGAWSELTTVTTDGTGTATINDPAPSPTSRFYRAVSLP